jgi:hypothetical protein
MSAILFYVSGHGYGHATRAGEVIQAIIGLRPTWTVHLTTTVHERFFPAGPGVRLRRPPDEIDAGVAERDALTVDPDATLGRVEALYRRRDQIVAAEAAFARREGIDIIVADIPALAGYAAAAAEVPCVGIGNFTWDWIYEPYLNTASRWAPLLEWIRGGYAQMETFLKLPFSHPMNGFREVVEVPLVARKSSLEPESARRRLRIDLRDTRPLVLIAMRGFPPPELLDAVARSAPVFSFLSTEGAERTQAENVLPVDPTAGLGFPDLLVACDVVVGKLGYGMLAEATTAGTAILYPPRTGFREDDLLQAGARRYARAREIPLDDFRAGNWAAHLGELLAAPPPSATLTSAGAAVCAAEIIRRVEQRQWVERSAR